MMSQVNVLSADASGSGSGSARCGERVQQCWQFEHPRRDLILDASGESRLLRFGASAIPRVSCLTHWL